MRIEFATAEDIAYVASNMRGVDLRELSATSHAETKSALVAELVTRMLHVKALVARHDGVPVVIGGAFEPWPKVATLFMFATDDLPKVALPLTRFIKRRLIALLKEEGVHRIQALTWSEHEDAHGWLEALGLMFERSLPNYGKNKELFYEYLWVSDAG